MYPKYLLGLMAPGLTLSILAITLYAMEKEPAIPNITFMINNGSGQKVTFYQLGTILPDQSYIFNAPGQHWQTLGSKKFSYHITMESPEEKNVVIETKQSKSKLSVFIFAQSIKPWKFNIDKAESYLFPFTIANDLTIEIGKLEKKHYSKLSKLPELPDSLKDKQQSIIIGDKEFQISKALIELRAPKLKNLI